MSNLEQLLRTQQTEHIMRRLNETGDPVDNLWVAPLPKSSHRLVHWRQYPIEGILQIETLQSEEGFLHVRIYLTQTETHVPTIVIGHPSVVGIYAWRDQKPAYPLQPNRATPLEETHLTWPADFEALHVVKSMNVGKTSYYVRPTSFLLAAIEFARLVDTPVKIKRFTNVFNGTTFSHITSPDEWEEAFPILGLHGLVTTNSPNYAAAHPEYEFVNIVKPQQSALLARNQSSDGQSVNSML